MICYSTTYKARVFLRSFPKAKSAPRGYAPLPDHLFLNLGREGWGSWLPEEEEEFCLTFEPQVKAFRQWKEQVERGERKKDSVQFSFCHLSEGDWRRLQELAKVPEIDECWHRRSIWRPFILSRGQWTITLNTQVAYRTRFQKTLPSLGRLMTLAYLAGMSLIQITKQPIPMKDFLPVYSHLFPPARK